jgi:predicted PurR-regulated permease PerM
VPEGAAGIAGGALFTSAHPGPSTSIEPPAAVPIRASLTILAIAASIWILDRGKEFFVPVIVAALLAFTLMPLVRLGQRFRVPPAAVATLILVGAGVGGGALVSSNADDAARLIGQMPELTQFIVTKVRRLLLVSRDDQALLAHRELHDSPPQPGTSGSSGTTPPRADANPNAPLGMLSGGATDPGPAIETIADPVNMRDLAAKAATGLATGAGKAFVIALLTFFLLISADSMKTKLFNLAGSRLSQKKNVLRALEESGRQIQLYLLITITANLIIAVLAWLLLYTIGVESAASWAIGLGIAHTVPYLGAIAGTLLISMAAVFQFESWEVGLYVLSGLGVICAVIGTLIMTLMQGRAAKMDPAVLFIGLLLFTWLWGGWGLLLGAPILAVTKTVMSYGGGGRINDVLEG